MCAGHQSMVAPPSPRIIPQRYTFELSAFGRVFAMHPKLRPSLVTITVRYTDWWYWEDLKPLELDSDHLRGIEFPQSVARIVMQLETIESHRKELEDLIGSMLNDPARWSFSRQDGVSLQIKKAKVLENTVQEWKWDGPTTFGDGRTFPHHPQGDTMPYIIKVLTWEVFQPEAAFV
ncbi:hypothetical protein DM02DRAFT_102569 [Periconia macrospinosa]|uniref:Uncharacterized protein n=1 Tax=Periconia macrospinosa TaxID=97972 RepID=A0A2V1CWD8_9PLEO|nr:hypothetical protein DM02DRAFT_102569 [Periconia macrospinosa]